MEDKLDIVNLIGIGETRFLGNYLGFPLIHKGRRRNEFHYVVERVQAKLDGWKSKCLSPVGRLVLIKAAVTAIPEYTMQCHKLPAKICDEVNKLVRNFLWGSTADKKKMHLVGWHKVTNPTNIGGLGIFDMHASNVILLAKLCWQIASSPKMLWAQMLTCKYLTPLHLRGHSRNQTAS